MCANKEPTYDTQWFPASLVHSQKTRERIVAEIAFIQSQLKIIQRTKADWGAYRGHQISTRHVEDAQYETALRCLCADESVNFR